MASTYHSGTYRSGQAASSLSSRDMFVSPRVQLARYAVEPIPLERARQVDPVALSALIECEVIPRLMGAHRPCDRRTIDAEPAIAAEEVAAFVPMTLQVEADELMTHVEHMLARGVSAEALLLDLLAPAARTLGEFWKDDRCDFIDVTMGLWRLQEVVHELSARVPVAQGRGDAVRSGLFAAVPGDQHSFGPLVIEQVFARAGWTTHRLCESSPAVLCDRVADEWFDIVGLTGSSGCHIGALPSVITAMRSVSHNPHLRVLVGGPVFIDDAQLADRVGADGTAPDALAALVVADQLLSTVSRKARI